MGRYLLCADELRSNSGEKGACERRNLTLQVFLSGKVPMKRADVSIDARTTRKVLVEQTLKEARSGAHLVVLRRLTSQVQQILSERCEQIGSLSEVAVLLGSHRFSKGVLVLAD